MGIESNWSPPSGGTSPFKSDIDRLRAWPLRIRIIGAILAVIVSVSGAALVALVKLGNEAAKTPAAAAAESGPSAGGGSGGAAGGLPGTATTGSPPTAARPDPTPPPTPPDEEQWIDFVNSECSAAIPALNEAAGRDDVLDGLAAAAAVTRGFAADLASVDGAPAAVSDAVDHLTTASDRYGFAHDLVMTGQGSDAVDIMSEGDQFLTMAMDELRGAGAEACLS